jgi:hypothetical protein
MVRYTVTESCPRERAVWREPSLLLSLETSLRTQVVALLARLVKLKAALLDREMVSRRAPHGWSRLNARFSGSIPTHLKYS